jgi:hypothetical protein
MLGTSESVRVDRVREVKCAFIVFLGDDVAGV